MRTIRYRLLAAVVAVLLSTALGNAQSAEDAPPPPPAGHEFGMGHMMQFWASKLNLTDEQQTQMKSVLEKERPNLKPLMEQERQIDTQLRQYVEGTYDAAKVQALASAESAYPRSTRCRPHPHDERDVPVAHHGSALPVEADGSQPGSPHAATHGAGAAASAGAVATAAVVDLSVHTGLKARCGSSCCHSEPG